MRNGRWSEQLPVFLAHRVDKNQPSIVKTFRQLGCMVQHLHGVGGGVFDLMVAVDFLNIFVEIKDGRKPPSQRKLTPAQKEWHFNWTGLRAVITSDYEAKCLVDQARALVAASRAAAITPKLTGSREKQYEPSLY